MAFTKERIRRILEPIYAGNVDLNNLPPEIYNFIYQNYREKMEHGFGEKLGQQMAGSERERFMRSANDNIARTAASKTFQQVRDFQRFAQSQDFEDFVDEAEPTFRKYNEVWQNTEEQLSFRRSRAGNHWAQIQENKDLYPFLEYRTQGDKRVRDEHEELEGIIKPVDDPFWDTYFPPNGWRCRCPKPRQRQQAKESEVDERELPELEDVHNDNPGKTGKVFKDDHPYFDVPGEFREAQDNNFGFDIPE